MMSRHWKMFTGRHFQNGRHNTAKIQHCPISSKFDMWIDNDVPNWFPTLKNFYRSPFSKWLPQYRKNSTLSDFNAISYVGRLWCPELVPDIVSFCHHLASVVCRPLTFHILIFSSVTPQPNELKLGPEELHLWKVLYKIWYADILSRSINKHGCHRQLSCLGDWS